MKCSYCGKNNKEGALFCKRCGIGLPPAPPPGGRPEAGTTALTDPAPVQDHTDASPAAPAAPAKPTKRKKQLWLVLAALLVAAAALAIVIFANSRGEILPSGSSYSVANTDVFYRGESVIPEGASVKATAVDLDGSTVGALTEDGLLYCFTDGRVDLAARYVDSFDVSAEGTHIIYTDENGLLWSFDCSEPENAPVCICNDLVSADFAVSPDGKTVILNKQTDDSLYLFSDRKLTVIGEKLSPVAVSNGAKHIWAYSGDENALYHCDKRGNRSYVRGGVIDNVYLNSTHEELALSTRSGEDIVITMVSFGANEPIEVANSNASLRPVRTVSGIEMAEQPTFMSGRVITCPYKSFDKRVFSGGMLVRFDKTGSTVLEPKQSGLTFMTDDYGTLFYCSDGALLRTKPGSGTEPEKVASDVIFYLPSTNGSRIWYLGADSVLYSMRGTSVTAIAPQVDDFRCTPNGNDAIYIKDGILCRNSGGSANQSFFFGDLHASELGADNYGLYALTQNGWMKLSSGGEKVTW